MILESIKKQREKTFSERRRLLSKITANIQEKYRESVFLGNASIHTFGDSIRIYNICDCCGKRDIPNEKITRIESGQLLCPACLRSIYVAS